VFVKFIIGAGDHSLAYFGHLFESPFWDGTLLGKGIEAIGGALMLCLRSIIADV
jgi:hypothetical protein